MLERSDRNLKGISGYNLDSLKENLLVDFVDRIIGGYEVKYYPYDSRTGKNISTANIILSPAVLIVEGIHSFHKIIISKIDLKIFIDGNSDTLKKLRHNANINKRRFSQKEAYKRIDKEMEEYYHYISPNKKYSDRIITMDEKYNYQL
jgi:uridine kinase